MIRAILLSPFQALYGVIVVVRNWLYDCRLIGTKRAPCKVVSVGNLTAGGTGKTPVTLALIERLRACGRTCGVVSRGYGRRTSGVMEVRLESRAAGSGTAATFGDEPILIKATFPDLPVFVGEKRARAVERLAESNSVDVVLCDDAFQHRRLHRDLNLVLLDATESLANLRLLPVGRGREPTRQAMKRADLIIVTKANLAGEDRLGELLRWCSGRTDRPVAVADYRFAGFQLIGTGEIRPNLGDGVYLISGVAKPGGVESLVGAHARVIKHRKFRDHHFYTGREVDEMLDEASVLQARWLVTTAKDGVKLGGFTSLRDRLWVAKLAVEFRDGGKELDEILDRILRKGD